MDALPPLAKSLLVVTGKGGVGKSTVAAALGLAAARRGRRVIVVEVAARADVSRALGASGGTAYSERVVGDRLHHISIDPEHALEDYLRRQLLVRALARPLARNRMFAGLAAAAPGLRELLTIGKAWELAQPSHRNGGRPYDLVVLDAPATGHGVAMLQAPRTFATVARVGPVARQARDIASFIADRRRTGVVGVCGPEEMPVAETLALHRTLGEDLDLALDRVVVNGVFPDRFTAAEVRVLRAAPPAPARRAALFEALQARRHRAQVARLRRGLGDVAVLTLPFLFEGASEPAALARLSRRLGG